MFLQEPPIVVHWYVDASDCGLVVADLAKKRFIQLDLDDQESSMICSVGKTQPFNINVRELFCVAFASLLWGHDCATHSATKMVVIQQHQRCHVGE
ncbi:hypothetical protein PF011_g7078 [Phytophthora fragariae]|uniref:Uncharacterized protein n=1 Tax=Phytophthora fragariae TaxID=53985 RepID=A0A6A3LAW6_9STRA|nr:hypothetical protein PF011_g7078 [Phytophthora fragariae]